MADKSLNEEAGLPPSWVPVDTPPIVPGKATGSGAPPTPVPLGNYLAGSISPSLQHDASFVKTAYGTLNIPQFPLMPVAIGGTPSGNAAIQSIVRTEVINGSATPGGTSGDFQYNNAGTFAGAPGITTVDGNSMSIAGVLSVIGTIDSQIGFQIVGTAPLGQYLRGDGMEFVSSVLDVSDAGAGLLPIIYGGTGTPTPSLIEGTNITITGSWPNQTINSTGGSGADNDFTKIFELMGG